MSIEAMKQALEALEHNRKAHYYCEDTWYSCPKHEEGCANDAEGDECNCGADKSNAEIDAAITSLRQAIATEEFLVTQEPVGEKVYDPEDDTAYIQYFIPHELIPIGTKFYTHPQPKAGQIDAEWLARRTEASFEAGRQQGMKQERALWELARIGQEIEATEESSAVQKPVAFITNRRQRMNVEIKPNAFVWMPTTTDWEIPLYTHPQPKAEQEQPDNKCPDKERTEYVCSNRHQCWEPCGELGKSEEHTKIYEKEPKREPLTDEQIEDIWNRYCDELGEASINDALEIARAIEAAHGIKGDA